MTKDRTKIAYFTTIFPATSETATIKEIHGLEAAGLDVSVYSFRKPKDKFFDKKVNELKAQTTYWNTLDKLAAIKEHLYRIAKFDKSYLEFLKNTFKTGSPDQVLLKNLSAILFALSVIDKLRKENISYIHTNFGSYQATAALAVNRLTGIPYGFSLHAHEMFAKPSMLEQKLTYASLISSISEYNREWIKKRFPKMDHQKIKLVRCGVDLELFKFNHRKKPANNKTKILSVGRITPMKGFEYLIKAVISLVRDNIPLELDIVGKTHDKLSGQLNRLIKDAGLESEIKLSGTISEDELFKRYADADIFVLPCVTMPNGEQDGIPAVLMEAMAKGLPSISTEISGIPELLIDKQTGLLAKPGNVSSLATTIKILIEDNTLQEKLCEKARQKVEQEYDYMKNAKILAGFIGEVVREI